MKNYDPSTIEPKWQRRWEEAKACNVNLRNSKNPYYSLVMFPYPSGDKLHVGHWYNFAPADSWSRYMRMRGRDVFEPMGFDAFGLPAENYAIKTGVPPAQSTAENVKSMIAQLKRIGCMYDWEKMVNTSDPSYYRWTQWLFLQMHKHGLAYKKLGNVNFCPDCRTVLANEQVWEGKCERCENEVVQKPLEQWYWRITKYADKLLDNLKDLDWPRKTKIMQEHWIGKSEGAEITFRVADYKRGIVGPMNWPDSMDDPSLVDPSLAAGLNRRLTKQFVERIHSRVRTIHLVFTPYQLSNAFDEPSQASRILRILDAVAARHDIVLHEAAAMKDHVHVLVSFAEGRHLERDIQKKLKGASAREFLKSSDADAERLWGQKGHFEEVTSSQQFLANLRYIQQNPADDGVSAEGRILSQLPLEVRVFTTRPDTLFGVTYMVLAPEHPLIDVITEIKYLDQISKYREKARKQTDLQRELSNVKTGVPTGAYAINPASKEKIPIWIADYVLMSYGTGAVMAVPAHDERDHDFAKKYGLPVVGVVAGGDVAKSAYTENGPLVNSAFLNGMSVHEAKKRMIAWLEDEALGRRDIHYRLRDWLVSRQRYWGAPIPIVYDPEGKAHPVPEEHLPWMLPTDVEFKPTGTSPLTCSNEFIGRTEKIFGKGWRPEFDTMDTFVCSSFYYLRYLMIGAEHEHKNELVDPEIERTWMPVSMYIGGPEHACMHLIYARFVMMALKDFGYVSHEEPFKKLVHQGLITNKGAKMSKSKGNVVSPDGFVERHGSDVFRMYLMFMGPFTDGGDWNDSGIRGIDRFVQRVWRIFGEGANVAKNAKDAKEVEVALHRTIKKVTESMEKIHFNTAISALMEFLHAIEGKTFSSETAKTFAKLIAPLAPHLAEELWEKLHEGQRRASRSAQSEVEFVINQSWPEYDPKLLVSDAMVIVVQVNGKVRGQIEVISGSSEQDILDAAKSETNVRKFLRAKEPKKAIYIKEKLVNLVV